MPTATSPWLECPECPHCGAIQGDPGNLEGTYWRWTCHSCGKRFVLVVQVTRRFRSTKEAD